MERNFIFYRMEKDVKDLVSRFVLIEWMREALPVLQCQTSPSYIYFSFPRAYSRHFLSEQPLAGQYYGELYIELYMSACLVVEAFAASYGRTGVSRSRAMDQRAA